MKKRGILILILTYLISISGYCYADSTTEIGRYLTIINKPKTAQIDLLSQTIQVRFPQDVQTIGDAMNYILRLSGYSLVPVEHLSNFLKVTLTKPLPAIDRDFGPMTLKDALIVLAGPAFILIQDPLNRMVDFRLKSQYISIYADHTKEQHSS